MASEPKLVVALEARLNKFESQMKEAGLIADRGVRDIESKFEKANPKLSGGFLKGLLGGALGAISLDRLSDGIQRVVGDLAKIGDQSERVGVTAGQLQELQFAIAQSGGEASQAGPALERFANSIARASEGEGKLARFLLDNNVALKDRNGTLRPTAELLGEVANLIQNAATPQERLNIATAFFGNTAGPAMVTALSNGAAGLRLLGAQAQGTGAIIEDELIKKAKEIDDKWNALARTWGVTVKSAIISMISAVEGFTQKADIASSLDAGRESAEQLAAAIALARSKGSPIDPSWITQLDRLLELQRELNRGNFSGPGGVKDSTLANVANKGGATNTSGLNSRLGVESKDAFERAQAQVERRRALLEAETGAIDLNAAARQRARIEAELETAARQANADAGLKDTEVTDAQRATIEKLAFAYEQVAEKAAAANGPLLEFGRSARDTNRLLQDAAVEGLRGIEDALIGVIDGTKTAAEAFKAFAQSVVNDLTRIAIRSAITGPLATAFGAGLPGRAAGGPVAAGMPYIVGERGPELFVPKSMGTIVPNRVASRTGGSTISVVIHSSPVFQAGMTPTDVAAIRADMAQNNVELHKQILTSIRSGQRDNPRFLGG